MAQTKHLVVIGASAGGIDALRELVGGLAPSFPAAVAIVLHTSPHSPGVLHEILTRAGPLPAISPRDGEQLRPGCIFVAPPDRHLLIEPGRVRVTKGPRENRFRPAVDPLFRSAAQVFGPAAIGVILTGNLDDGAAGLWIIKQLGGIAIVQDPGDALFPSMPANAMRAVDVDFSVPLADMPALLARLTAAEVGPQTGALPEALDVEIRIAKEEDPMEAGIHGIAEPSPLACPECHGVLLEVKEGGRSRFRCHTGHAYSPQSLLSEINEAVETSLWNAIRSMQEGSMLMQRMAGHRAISHPEGDGSTLAERAKQLERQADALRRMVGDAATVTSGEAS